MLIVSGPLHTHGGCPKRCKHQGGWSTKSGHIKHCGICKAKKNDELKFLEL